MIRHSIVCLYTDLLRVCEILLKTEKEKERAISRGTPVIGNVAMETVSSCCHWLLYTRSLSLRKQCC